MNPTPSGKPVLVLELPFPPSVNTYWRKTGWRTLLSAKARTFRLAVGSAVVVARAGGQIPKSPLDGRLVAELTLYPPDRRTRDVDNYAKGVLDALTHARVWHDDSQLDRLVLAWGEPVAGGKAVINVYQAGRNNGQS